MLRARYTGVAAVVVLWTTITFAVHRTGLPVGGSESLSDLSRDPRSDLLYSGALAVAAGLFLVFHHHLRERYRVSGIFSAFMLLGIGAQFVAAVVPLEDSGRDDLHMAALAVMVVSVPLLIWRFAVEQRPGRWQLACYGLFAFDVVACLLSYAVTAHGDGAASQIIRAVGFHAWIVAVTIKPRVEVIEIPVLAPRPYAPPRAAAQPDR